MGRRHTLATMANFFEFVPGYSHYIYRGGREPLFEAALANLAPRSPAAVDRKSATRGPLLITAGGKDHTVPATVSRQTQKLYRARLR